MKRRVLNPETVATLVVLALLALAMTGCAAKIADKTVVQINYKGTLADGTVFDSSEGGQPLEFVFGVGMMIPGLEDGLRGMKVGDKKRIDIKAAKAYGERSEDALQEIPRSEFPEDMELVVGRQLSAQTQNGQVFATITEIRDKTVMLDFNHPLAGKDLVFDVEVVKIRKATKEELSQLQTVAQ